MINRTYIRASVAEVRKVIAVQFGILSPKRIRDMSVAEIKLPALKVVRVSQRIFASENARKDAQM
jgi:hypothetical protein